MSTDQRPILYLPQINRDDFDAFKRMMKGGLTPETFEQWGEFYQGWVKYHDAGVYGDTYARFEGIPLSPEDFDQFCKQFSRAYDVNSLLTLAATRGEVHS